MQGWMVCGVRELGAGGRDGSQRLTLPKVRSSDGEAPRQAGKKLQSEPCDGEASGPRFF